MSTPANAVDEALARKMWRTLEPYHGMIYFVPEGVKEYGDIGLPPGRMGYFASRSAPMGPVPPEVVVATFFNFNPELVYKVIPAAWTLASPETILAARFRAADSALRRILGDGIDDIGLAEAAALAKEATTACAIVGRPLFAGHVSVPWPDDPHLVLWHAISLLREFRGDGHVAALTADGVNGIEALVMHGASGDVPPEVLRMTRAWSDNDWSAASDRLRERGWLKADGELTEEGRAHRQDVEDRTDRLAVPPWEHLGRDACDRLRELVRPFSQAVVAAGTFSAPPG